MATIDLRSPKQVNFEVLEQDLQKITQKLLENQDLLKLLYYNGEDALSKDDIEDGEIVLEISKENIRVCPKLNVPENKGSYVILTFDNFVPNKSNIKFIDNMVIFDILCPIDSWQMDSYMLRPYKIMSIIQGLMDKQKLNGIGKVNFAGANLLNLGDYAGYQIAFETINDV